MIRINFSRWVAIFCCVYLILSLNPFVLWLTWPPLINIPVYIILFFFGLILLSNSRVEFTRERFFLALLVFLFTFHINLPITSDYSDYGRAFSFIVFILIIFFPRDILIRVLHYFIKFHVVICISAVIVFFITAIIDIPHLKITNKTAILQNTDYYYKLYGFVVSSTNTVYNIGGLSIGRICGIYPEPGHFATYLSFIIIAQRLLSQKINRIFYVAGSLTFSPVFYITLLLLFGYDIIIKKKAKTIRNYLVYSILFLTAIIYIGDSFKDQLWELAFGRNFSSGIETRLDERADQVVLSAYEGFALTPDFWVGKGVTFVEELGIFSDFRGFIFKYGVLGLVLSFWITLFLILKAKSLPYYTLLLPFAFLVYFQRSWMFGSTYMYMMFFILLICFRYHNNCEQNKNYSNV